MGDSRPEWADAFDGIKALDNSWASRFKASIEPLAVPLGMASRVSEIRDSILPLQKMSFSLPVPPSTMEAMSSLGSVYSNALLDVFSDIGASLRATIDTASIFQGISDSLQPLYDRLAALNLDLDWKGLRQGYVGWGDLGWIVPREMSFSEIRVVPQSLEEADKACMRYFGRSDLEALFERLCDGSHKKRDLQEAVELFNERRYKPCAMMLCALIEGELIRIGGRVQGRGRRSGRRTIGMISERAIERETCLAFTLENYSKVWDYFYKDGKDFSREREGELNRNFLLHGMMYKPVRKKTCVKLFCLLDATVELLPMVAEF